MKFNERLKAIRIESGKTQKEVYTALEMSANGYASYEQGRTEPSVDTLIKLCKIFAEISSCTRYNACTRRFFVA